jgi:hypothetical protein
MTTHTRPKRKPYKRKDAVAKKVLVKAITTVDKMKEADFLAMLKQQIIVARAIEIKAHTALNVAQRRYDVQRAMRLQTEERIKGELKTYCEKKGLVFDESNLA